MTTQLHRYNNIIMFISTKLYVFIIVNIESMMLHCHSQILLLYHYNNTEILLVTIL